MNNFDGFHFFFLSEGIAEFPSSAINTIKASKEVLSKFRITALAFDDDQSAKDALVSLD